MFPWASPLVCRKALESFLRAPREYVCRRGGLRKEGDVVQRRAKPVPGKRGGPARGIVGGHMVRAGPGQG